MSTSSATNTEKAAMAAIDFALSADEGSTFLRLWRNGDFDAIRKEWPEAPSSVFLGAEPGAKAK